MALVDYSSDDDDDASDNQKEQEKDDDATPLPPLPRAFHDLYAATVRTAPADLPSLHHGRRRAIPHVPGQWPSHLYIEWFPLSVEYERLNALLAALRDRLDPLTNDRIHSLVTSDLAVPLPLHISLSRPFVLPTAGKAGFLRALTAAVASAGVGAFSVVFRDLVWYRGPDSTRAFLVLRAEVEGVSSDDDDNPLVALLDCCNEQVTAVGQPALYADASSSSSSSSAAQSFHVSIAWTLADDDITAAWCRDATRDVYEQWTRTAGGGPSEKALLRMPVESIKAKIGNVVTDLPLANKTASLSATTTATRKRGCKRAREDDDDDGGGSDGGDSNTNPSKKSDKSSDTRRKGKSLFGL